MKNSQKGFILPVLIVVIALLAIGAGTYVYLNKKQNDSPTGSNTSQITDFKNVKDFYTCMSYAKNTPTTFDIVFLHAADIQEVRNFGADFKMAYPRAELKISTEQDFLDEAIAYNGGSIKTASGVADYKKMIMAEATSKISVQVPYNDLGSLQSFNNFISTTLNKYAHIKFQQYAGSSPIDTLSTSFGYMNQKAAEEKCDHTYKKLNAFDRASLDIKTADSKIQMDISDTRSNALEYYNDHNSYASGTLSLNNGICSDTGIYGLKKTVDAIREIAGEVYCYASSKEYAVSAPLKSTSTTGYCADSTSFSGTVSSPTAASKGYCLIPPKKISQDISACKAGATARERWICVGNMVDPLIHIYDAIAPFATPVSQKIDFCKTYKGIEADYCFSSIVKAGWGLNVDGSPDTTAVCKMVSDQSTWFKNDCNKN